MDCTIYLAKTMALITAKLICVFVFAYAKNRFSHDAAQLCLFMISNEMYNTSPAPYSIFKIAQNESDDRTGPENIICTVMMYGGHFTAVTRHSVSCSEDK